MVEIKSKSLENIEQRMARIDESSLRYRILQKAKEFKTSWIALGQALYAVWSGKLYTRWGYPAFEAYASKEIGIRKQTALKLLKSYYFLEKEAPSYARDDFVGEAEASRLPSFESVDLLRRARRRKDLNEDDYDALRRDVLEKGKDVREVKKDLTALIRQREVEGPEEARQKKKVASVKRLLSTLKSLKRDAETLKLLPADIIKDTDKLIDRIESALK